MEIPEKIKKKFEEVKAKIEKLTESLKKEYKEKLIGISLLPPQKLTPEEEKRLSQEEKDKITNRNDVLILVNLDKEKDPLSIKDKIIKFANEKAAVIDKELKPFVLELYDLREDCFDAKWETIQDIAASAPIYDPNELIAAIRISEVHKSMVLKKFEKYIVSYVAAGSMFRGDRVSHDIDVWAIVDDTDVKKMTRVELRDKLGAIMRKMGDDAARITGVKKQFHIQTYILTDSWEWIKDAHPVIFTVLRDGVPLYDRGVFMPWKLLLKMGKIKPSPESIEMMMTSGERMIYSTKSKLISVMGSDLFWAVFNTAQAALMLYGVAPPTPRETIQLMEDIFVKKEKILEQKYVDDLKSIFKYFKDIEHGKIKEVSGKEVDTHLKKAEEFLKRIKELFIQLQKKRDKESVFEMHKTVMDLIKDALEVEKVNVAANANLPNLFKKHLVDKKFFPSIDLETVNKVEKTKKEFATKKMNPTEVEKVRREGRMLIKDLFDFIQRKKAYELDRAKIRFKYGEKYGEALLLEKEAYVIEDLSSENRRVIKAKLQDGNLGSFDESSFEEYEKAIKGIKIPPKVFIKEHIFEGLKKQFGSDIEILINY